MNMKPASERRSIGNQLSRAFIPLWGIGLLVVSSTLMAGHWVTLPHPNVGERVPGTAMHAIASDPNWTASEGNQELYAFHILYGDCPCSRRVLNRVLERRALDGVRERIVLIGESQATRDVAENMGYEFDAITPSELTSKYGVEAAPLLIVANRDAQILYSGGYTARKQGFDIRDVEIISDLRSGKQVEEMPLYGCAVSVGLKAIIDPLRLK